MAKNIVDFNSSRQIKQTPVGVYLTMFEPTNVSYTTASLDNLYLSTINITKTGSGYTSAPTVTLTMVTGTVISSASVTSTVSSGKVTAVSFVGGKYSLDSRVSASFTGGGGSGATAYVALSKSKKVNSFYTKQPIYDDYTAAKEKLKLILHTKKGEIPRNPDLGTRIHEVLLRFNSMDEIVLNNEVTRKFSKILEDDILQQVPEVEVISIRLNKANSNISKNLLSIELVTRHRYTNKVFTIDLTVGSGILKEYYINDQLTQKPVSYLV